MWGLLAGAAGNLLGGFLKSKGEKRAAGIQAAAAQQGIDEQRTQLDYFKSLMDPYSQGGLQAFQAQQNLLGLGGQGSQQAAIDQIQNNPQFMAMAQQGENSLLQNASATGGLRGGNIQGALAQFRPSMLNQLIQQQYSNLGGLSSAGFNANSILGQAGQQTGMNVADLLSGKGQAQAGGKLSQYGFAANLPGMLGGDAGVFAGLKSAFGKPAAGATNAAAAGAVPQSFVSQFGGL